MGATTAKHWREAVAISVRDSTELLGADVFFSLIETDFTVTIDTPATDIPKLVYEGSSQFTVPVASRPSPTREGDAYIIPISVTPIQLPPATVPVTIWGWFIQNPDEQLLIWEKFNPPMVVQPGERPTFQIVWRIGNCP